MVQIFNDMEELNNDFIKAVNQEIPRYPSLLMSPIAAIDDPNLAPVCESPPTDVSFCSTNFP